MTDRDRNAHASGVVTHVAIHRTSPSGSMKRPDAETRQCARRHSAQKIQGMATSTSKRHGPLISTSEIEAIIRARSCPGLGVTRASSRVANTVYQPAHAMLK